ncbi:hypothetical protein D3C72_685330 [compost metagenome]
MMMRVKPVIISKAAGRNDSDVISSIVCMLSEYVSEPLGPGVAVRAGRVAWATTPAGKKARPSTAAAASMGRARGRAGRSVVRERKLMGVAKMRVSR